MTQKKVSGTSSNGPPRNYRGALETNLKTCVKGTKLRVYTPRQSYVRNHGINGIVDPKILAEGGRVYHHHQFQAVFQLGLKCRRMN